MHRLAIAASALALTACATDTNSPQMRQIAGQPIQYQDGYKAGCDSGYVAAGHPYYRMNKDVVRFGSDQLYAQGWNDGFQVCKGGYESIRRSLR